MKVNYNLRKVSIKDSTKQHIDAKIKKLEKFFSDEADVLLKFVLETNQVKAEITIKDKSTVYRAEDVQTDLSDAFDNAFDNLIRRIRKQKTKLEKRLRSTAFPDEFYGVEEEEQQFEVIRSKQFIIEPISVDEAILQMNLLGHQFYVFENEDNNKTSIVYKRNDGKYGLIEPEKF